MLHPTYLFVNTLNRLQKGVDNIAGPRYALPIDYGKDNDNAQTSLHSPSSERYTVLLRVGGVVRCCGGRFDSFVLRQE